MTTRKTTKLGLRRFRGNAVLDAALVLPVLLSLTFGMIEYGYFFFVKHSMQGAAREGCRNAILSSATAATVKSAVVSSLYASGLNSSSTTLDSKYTFTMKTGTTTITDPSTVAQGSSISVQLDATWGTIGVRPLGLIGAAKTCTGVTVMRKES